LPMVVTARPRVARRAVLVGFCCLCSLFPDACAGCAGRSPLPARFDAAGGSPGLLDLVSHGPAARSERVNALRGGSGVETSDHLRGGGLPGYSSVRIPQPPDTPPDTPPAVLVPQPPQASPPATVHDRSRRAKCVLPEVTTKGSLVDMVGWAFALLTCSLKSRRQLRLDERLWLAAAMGDTELCERLIAKGANVLAESHDGGDDPRVYFKVRSPGSAGDAPCPLAVLPPNSCCKALPSGPCRICTG